jgi:hypothetical protein
MKCLSRIEIQEFIDNEVDPDIRDEIHSHLATCDLCLSLYNEASESKVLINKLLSSVMSEKNSDVVPEFIPPVKTGNRKSYITTVAVLAAASLIGFIFLLRLHKEPIIVQIPESEILMYDFYEGKDLNKLWHDKSQIIIIQDEKGNVIQSIITY